MELKEFIKEAIADITNAVKESQDELDNGAIIAPINVYNGEYDIKWVSNGQESHAYAAKINFELSVVVEQKKDLGGNISSSISVCSAILSIGTKTKAYISKEKEQSGVSKINFSIPVVLPPKILPYNYLIELEKEAERQ